MGAIFGLLSTGATSVAASLQGIASALQIIPADVVGQWSQDSVGLGVRGRALDKTVELTEFLWRENNRGESFVVVADARLDNRIELLAKLGLAEAQPSTAELLLTAYKRWGESCSEHLLGDFVFTVWDARRKTLFLARDQLGARPLFIYRGDGVFGFASDFEGLFSLTGAAPQVCRDAVAHYLGQGELYSDTLTFFQGIEKLPPATSLLLELDKGLGSERKRRYWNPGRLSRYKDKDINWAVQSLRDLLKDAVSTRLPKSGPVAAHLSGGLDSSLVVALAAREVEPKPDRLQTWTWLRAPRSAGEENADEWQLGRLVAAKYGLHHHFVEFGPDELSSVFKGQALAANDSTDLWYEYPARKAMAATGARVVLSGWGGDQFISHSGHHVQAQSFWLNGEYRAVLGDFYRRSLAARKGRRLRRMIGLCYRQLLRPLSPFHDRAMSQALGRNYLRFSRADIASRARLAKVTRRRFYRGISGCELQLSELKAGHLLNRIESWAVLGNRQGLDYSYPLLDRRIVEFSLRLPAHFYYQQGVTRYIFREAMQGLVPDNVRAQAAQVEPHRVAELPQLLAPAIEKLLEASKNTRSDLVDMPAIRAEFHRLTELGLNDLEQIRMSGEIILKSLLVVQLEARFGLQSSLTSR